MNDKHQSDSTFPETADIETSSDSYALRFSGKTGKWMLNIQERITLNFIRNEQKLTVLDVGGGHGQIALPLCESGHNVTVLGSSATCSNRISSVINSKKCRFITGNVIELPFPDKSFDLVTCFRLLTHCRQWKKLISELCRTARKFVILDYPTSQSVNRIAPAFFGVKKKIEGDTRHWSLFKHSEVESEFSIHKFKKTGMKKQFFFPMALHRAMKCSQISILMEAMARGTGLTSIWGSPVIIKMERSNPDE